MARGWESKSVEQQQEEASSSVQPNQRLTPQQAAASQRRRGLELSRSRTMQQFECASNPEHKKMLAAALADLDAKLASLS